MHGDEVEVGGLGDESWLQSGKVTPNVEENGKHFGGMSWSSGTVANCLPSRNLPNGAARAKRSQRCYEYIVEASGSKGYGVAMSSGHGSGSIEDGRSCDLGHEVKSRRDEELESRLGTWH